MTVTLSTFIFMIYSFKLELVLESLGQILICFCLFEILFKNVVHHLYGVISTHTEKKFAYSHSLNAWYIYIYIWQQSFILTRHCMYSLSILKTYTGVTKLDAFFCDFYYTVYVLVRNTLELWEVFIIIFIIQVRMIKVRERKRCLYICYFFSV